MNRPLMHHRFLYFGAISVLLVLSQTPSNTARPWIQASASRGVPVYSPGFAGTYNTYPQRMVRFSRPGRLVLH